MSRLKDPKFIFWTVVLVALMVGSRLLLPVPLPHLQLPAEPIPGLAVPLPFGAELPITNTMIAILSTDVLLILLALAATRRLELVPTGLQNLFEAIIEWWEDLSIQMLGEDLTRRYLPLFLTYFLLVALANWSELLPGYDSVGILIRPEAAAAEGNVPGEEGEQTLFQVHWLGEPGRGFGLAMRRLDEPGSAQGDAQAVAEGEGEGPGAEAAGWAFVPFLRVASSDLSFTLALAIVSFVATEIVGFQTLGLRYLRKFFNFDFSRGVATGVLNVFVGLLELVSELARIISFSFRLFGNLFAGQTLLFVIPFLIPLLAVLPVYGLELFAGMIQAFVFAVLTLAFMAVAIASHGGDSH